MSETNLPTLIDIDHIKNGDYVVMDVENWPKNHNSQIQCDSQSPIEEKNDAGEGLPNLFGDEAENNSISEIHDPEMINGRGGTVLEDDEDVENNMLESDGDTEDDDELDHSLDINFKQGNILLNAAGHRVDARAVKHATEMKQKFIEFMKNSSPNNTFDKLIKMFLRRIPPHRPVYVLSHDHCPDSVRPLHQYAILCTAIGCENAYYRDGSDWDSITQTKNFFGFPSSEEMCKRWIESLNRTKYLVKSAIEMQMFRVCEDHFTPEDYTDEYRDELLEAAVPSLLLGSEAQEDNCPADMESDSDFSRPTSPEM